MSVGLFPAWKQAVSDLMKETPDPGHLITRKWLNEEFQLREPSTVTDYKEYQIEFMQLMSAFKDELLTKHCIALKTIPGKGYEILEPGEQTDYCFQAGLHGIRKNLLSMNKHLINVDHSKLTADQCRENADALAKTASMAGMIKRVRRVGVDELLGIGGKIN